jgi:glycosyltransferase involved in cell wall biosynthesis
MEPAAWGGTLAFAVGCGRAIISTSYAHAREVLRDGRGLLAKEADPDELAALIKQILGNHKLKKELQRKASELGQTWTWPSIGSQYTSLFSKLLDDNLLGDESSINYVGL